MSDIRVFKMSGGFDIMGDVTEELEDGFVVKNAIVVLTMQNSDGSLKVELHPVSYMARGIDPENGRIAADVIIHSAQCMFIYTPNADIERMYASATSGIMLASSIQPKVSNLTPFKR